MVSHILLWRIHLAQHGYATSPDKPHHQDGSQEQKEDIEHTGVAPLYPLRDRHHSAVLWNDAQCLEKKLDHVACCCHRYVECHKNITHDAPAVIFAVNIQNRQDDQVSKNETDDAAKTNPAPP